MRQSLLIFHFFLSCNRYWLPIILKQHTIFKAFKAHCHIAGAGLLQIPSHEQPDAPYCHIVIWLEVKTCRHNAMLSPTNQTRTCIVCTLLCSISLNFQLLFSFLCMVMNDLQTRKFLNMKMKVKQPLWES